MSASLNGNGNSLNDSLSQLNRKAASTESTAPAAVIENAVVFLTTGGKESQGKLVQISRYIVTFETNNITTTLRTSEVLEKFKITTGNRDLYFGRAIVSNVVNTGELLVCEVRLDEPGVFDSIRNSFDGNIDFSKSYQTFFGKWQSHITLLPEFKLAVLDIQSYLSELKVFLKQVEISIVASSLQNRSEMERHVFQNLSATVLKDIDAMRERLLAVADEIHPDQHTSHHVFVQRQLHPFFLCAPFAHRTYHKPLGYAGDYEMMNMIHRNTFEGESLYAKLVHYWLVNQAPAVSVRNRVTHLKTKLVEETARVVREKRVARILNIGCGPAREVQSFLSEHVLANHAEFTLLDFDSETLSHASSRLNEIKNRNGRTTAVHTVQASVNQLIKDSHMPSQKKLRGEFDLIYCGGLFDYLSDRVCKLLVGLFYKKIAPGGLVLVANMADKVPFRKMQEFLLDWHLIYRDAHSLSSFVPSNAQPYNWSVNAESAGVNFFLELRKPQAN